MYEISLNRVQVSEKGNIQIMHIYINPRDRSKGVARQQVP